MRWIWTGAKAGDAVILTMKFGGTSMGDATRLSEVADIIQRALAEGHRVVAVVSAMSGVTNALVEASRTAAAGDDTRFPQIRAELWDRHRRTVEEVICDPQLRAELETEIRAHLDDLESFCRSIFILGELTDRALDMVSSMGERLSARMLAAILRDRGVDSQAVETQGVVVTNGRHGDAEPLLEETKKKVEEALLPLLRRGIVPVVTGFIGATSQGVITTLGRGGSDYTASILGSCLGEGEIWIWTDVDGVMTADPKVVPDARTIPQLSYKEVAELSYFGAKVVHPKTIGPAMEADMPIRIKNTFEPSHVGTLISRDSEASERAVKAVTAIRHLSLVTVEGRGMMGVPGVAAKVFTAVARASVNVLMISQSSSEQNICFVVREEKSLQAIRALEEEFALEMSRGDIDRTWSQDDVAIIAVVGAGMKGTPGVAAGTFEALGSDGINVISIAQGSSEFNISFVTSGEDVDRAVRNIHRKFGLGQA